MPLSVLLYEVHTLSHSSYSHVSKGTKPSRIQPETSATSQPLPLTTIGRDSRVMGFIGFFCLPHRAVHVMALFPPVLLLLLCRPFLGGRRG